MKSKKHGMFPVGGGIDGSTEEAKTGPPETLASPPLSSGFKPEPAVCSQGQSCQQVSSLPVLCRAPFSLNQSGRGSAPLPHSQESPCPSPCPHHNQGPHELDFALQNLEASFQTISIFCL